MSDVVGELALVSEAFEKPTLRLLDSKWAPIILSVFRSSFGRDNLSIPAQQFETQVDVYLDELQFAGTDVPGAQGRQLCSQWVKGLWLKRTVNDDGGEEYALTSHASDALELVRSLTRERALISESRINMILTTVSDWALEVNPDREARLADYDSRIETLTIERDRIAGGGVLDPISDERMLDGWDNLLQLVRSLPVDFKRVEESVQAMHRQLVAEFRDEDRSPGEVLEDYLNRSRELMTMTRAGQAFEGAISLMRSDKATTELRGNLAVLLDVPVTADILTIDDERDIRNTVQVIRRGIDDVLGQRSRASATLRDHIVNHDVRGDRELDRLSKELTKHLAKWMETAGPRAKVPIDFLPLNPDIGHFRESLYDPSRDEPPPPLADDDSTDIGDLLPDLEEMRSKGGPSLRELRTHLIDAFGEDGYTSAGDMFNALPIELRRPVEILGLLHVASEVTDLDKYADVEIYTAVRADGQVHDYRVPKIRLEPDETHALQGAEGDPR